MRSYTGVYTALITPFHSTAQLNEEGLRENVRFQIAAGVDGLVALGTTAETPTLTEEEKRRVVSIVLEEAEGKVPVLVGTGGYATQKVLQDTLLAQQWGADGVLVVAPYYSRPSQEGLYQHFSYIASRVEIPLVLYNHPKRTGVHLEASTLLRLAEFENIVGLKEVVYETKHLAEILHKTGSSFSLLTGDDESILPFMAFGAHGVISVLSNLLPHRVVELVRALQGDFYPEARPLYHALLPLIHATTCESNPVPIKTMMQLCGLPAGPVRLPLVELSINHQEQLQELLLREGQIRKLPL